MKKGASTVMVAIIVMLITIALILLTYQWLLSSSPKTQQELQNSLQQNNGCLKVEGINIFNKKISVRNCGAVDLSNFVVYLDSTPFVYYPGTLAAGSITQISYTNYINVGNHEIEVSSNYAESPKIIFYKKCDVYIYQSMMPYLINQNYTYYCLNESVNVAAGQTAINFSSGIQGSSLDCQNYNIDGTTSVYPGYGVMLEHTNSSAVKNCNITDFYYGIYFDYANNGIIDSNIVTSNTEGMEVDDSCFNNITNNIMRNNQLAGIDMTACSNNIIGGSIDSNSQKDYYMWTNTLGENFICTNFTVPRKIDFYQPNAWFSYNNETTGNIYLKTAAYVPDNVTEITRKLTSWSQSLLQWNDTFLNTSGSITTTYNITGLKPGMPYNVYNNSILSYTIMTDSSGNLNFTIVLPYNQEHEIKVKVVCDYYIFGLPYTISKSNSLYCVYSYFHIDGLTAITFANSVQNSTLDCMGNNIDGNDTTNTYGVYLLGSNTKNNIIKNCSITDFYYNVYLGGPNNTVSNNKINNSDNSGIEIESTANNVITNNTITMTKDNSNGGIYVSSSNNNIMSYNNITTSAYGVDAIGLNISSNNYITSNNMSVSGNFADGIWIYSGSNSNTIFNNIIANKDPAHGIHIDSSSYNNITGGSVISTSGLSYYLQNAGATNNFTSTNFTSARTIHFDDPASWFNYQNDSSSNIWLKTSASAISNITRKLINWNINLMQWNDTSDTANTATYNITGLTASTTYYVYNNTFLAYTLNSGLASQINFAIYLPASQERNITVTK